MIDQVGRACELPPAGQDRPIDYGTRSARHGGLGETHSLDNAESLKTILTERLASLLRIFPDGYDHAFHYSCHLDCGANPKPEARDKFLIMRHEDDGSLLFLCLPFALFPQHEHMGLAIKAAWTQATRLSSFPFQFIAGGVMGPAVFEKVDVTELHPDNDGEDCKAAIDRALQCMLRSVRTELSLSTDVHLDIWTAKDLVSKN